MSTPVAPRAFAYDWRSVPPADAGFHPDVNARLDKLVADKRAWGLHGVVVVRNDRLVLERYFEAEDNARGRPLGKVSFKPDTLHDLRSVSKSVVALMYGIALAQGKVPPPEASLYASFPEHGDLGRAEGRDRITLQHVLTMTMGTDWDETSLPYSNPANGEIAMDLAPDRYRYILERRVIMEPGRRWNYCGGATALLARLISKGTGRPLHSFAREALFDPLGLGPTEWLADAKGEPYAASGLRMTPRDLARIGMTVANGGVAEGRSVIPADWIRRCTTDFVSVDEQRRYGYQWYLGDFFYGKPLGWTREHLERWWGCFGEGGQRLFVLPNVKLAIAISAGNYGTDDQWIPPIRVVREVVLASLE
ncbi:MAG TPA: serine hydrolase domain-containing protein [Hyphomicrobiaceae bacterium]|nr:serine hydrolase domain-containing protein [Hyphomicrobiaceae bacterium]